MFERIRILPAVLAAVVVLASSGVLVAGKNERFRLRGDLRFEQTDNLFHFSDDRLATFDSQAAPGERFFGLDSESDTVGRVRLRGEYKRRIAKKRHLRFELGGTWFQHADNDIADYGEVAAGLAFDATKRDRFEATVTRTIDRFKKNYQLPDDGPFAAAFLDQTDVKLGYTHDIRGKDWEWGLDYAFRSRRYDDPFSSRDQDGDYLRLRTSYDMGKRVVGSTAFQLGVVDSGTVVDNGIPIDRSFDQYRFDQSFEFDLAKRTSLAVEVTLRRREFTTGEAADLGRFDRRDDLTRLRAELRRDWKAGWTLRLGAGALDNDSERIDPNVETDERGYDELVVHVGLGYEF